MDWATGSSNKAEARRIMGQWAAILREALDRARGP
jgi:hypothetical protein